MGKLFLFFILAFLIGILVSIKLQMYLSVGKTGAELIINGQLIKVEMAKTDKEISRGLSGRDKLDNNQAMLFIFEETGNYPFWMNGMKFDLDAVFIKGETVVDIIENIAFPRNNDQSQTFQAKVEFDKVLEVNSGTIKRLGIKVGDRMEFSK